MEKNQLIENKTRLLFEKIVNWTKENQLTNEFIFHYQTFNWGFAILVMEKNAKAFGRLYCYNDEIKFNKDSNALPNIKNIYIDSLSVSSDSRKLGLGRQLQEIREKIGLFIGAKYSYLWVDKNSWMFEWYKRRNYSYYKKHEEGENFIWMKKII